MNSINHRAGTQHLVAVCADRIGTLRTSQRRQEALRLDREIDTDLKVSWRGPRPPATLGTDTEADAIRALRAIAP